MMVMTHGAELIAHSQFEELKGGGEIYSNKRDIQLEFVLN